MSLGRLGSHHRETMGGMRATMRGMGATMGGYIAMMVASIPSTNDGIGSSNVSNTSSPMKKVMKKKVMRRVAMSHECHLQCL
jgi:hypothetical protein